MKQFVQIFKSFMQRLDIILLAKIALMLVIFHLILFLFYPIRVKVMEVNDSVNVDVDSFRDFLRIVS